MRYILFFAVLFFIQCSPKPHIAQKSKLDNKETTGEQFAGNIEDRLAAMLRRQSGVNVLQANGSYKVRVRGLVHSVSMGSDPLFIVNGISIGTNFKNAAESIAGNPIKSVRVLKGQDASFYGTRGAAGVILIKTGQNPGYSNN